MSDVSDRGCPSRPNDISRGLAHKTPGMGEVDDEREHQVLSYSAFLNRQLLEAWRERLRAYHEPPKKNRLLGHSLRVLGLSGGRRKRRWHGA